MQSIGKEAENSPVIYEDDVVRVRLQMVDESVPLLHAVVFKFGVREYRMLLIILNQIKKKLLELGFPDIYAMAHIDDIKLIKFCHMMGFRELGTIKDMIILYQEC